MTTFPVNIESRRKKTGNLSVILAMRGQDRVKIMGKSWG
jgi:hypothetical protein